MLVNPDFMDWNRVIIQKFLEFFKRIKISLTEPIDIRYGLNTVLMSKYLLVSLESGIGYVGDGRPQYELRARPSI